MSGHSKWSKIKHKKAATDAHKSKVFSKLVRYISVEAKKAKGDRNAPGLRLAIEKAKAANMPSDNVDRAIEKAGASGEMEAVMYEAYGPGGAAMMITGLTDSRNRTAAEIKHILGTHSAALASPGAASWAFAKEGEEWKATTPVEVSDADLEKLEALVDALEDRDDVQGVFTNAA